LPAIPIALTIAIALAGLALIGYAIVRLLAVLRASIIVRLPMLPEQDVQFAQAGPVVLCIETTHLDSSFAGVDFALRDAGGRAVDSAPIVFRSRVSGLSRVRLSVRTFDIPVAGRYRLIVAGIAPARDMSQTALVFTRPFVGAMVACILGIVLGGFALIGGIVFTALGLAGKL
jgi:hypothetical protein